MSARRYAFGLARDADAEIAGLAGIDLSHVGVTMPGAIGSAFHKSRLDAHLKSQASDARARLRDVFESECRERGVPFSWLSFEGEPLDALYLAAETRDIVVTGYDTAFQGESPSRLSEVLATLVKVSPRPVVLCPDEWLQTGRVLVAYDGSTSSMRAVQMLALLGIGRNRPIDVISVDESQELAARRASGVAGYLRVHGYSVEENPVVSGVHPTDVLRSEAASRKADTLVMGAYGQRGFGELLFGSVTRRLLEAPPCALLIYH